MQCPVCKSYEQLQINLHAEQFDEKILECACGTTWSVNHGLSEIVSDPNEKSFLSATAEQVEGDDYCWAM